MNDAIKLLALRMGDNALILAQQNSKWCGHAPTLEEDIAMANVSLDLFGQARLWLEFAAGFENKNADDFAYFRDSVDFRNAFLVELPNGDYAQTLVRQYLFDHWHILRIEALVTSSDRSIREIAQKSVNEVRYHLHRSSDLVAKLAKGSGESHERIQKAVNRSWPAFLSLFEDAESDAELATHAVALPPSTFKVDVLAKIAKELDGSIELPDSHYFHKGAVAGIHSENLGHILVEMQNLQRSYPGLEW